MITKKFLSDESGLTVALETILLFAISVIFSDDILFIPGYEPEAE